MEIDQITKSQIEPLLDYFKKVIPLKKEEKELVVQSFQPRLYRKRQFVLQQGDVCKYFNFVVRVCLRMYATDKKGSTHILQFAHENWWIADMRSFIHKEASSLNIDALEDTMVLQIDFEKLTGL